VIRDLAMLKARLDRLEAAEYTALMTAIDADGNAGNPDSASAYLTAAPNLANLERTERFLRRNYMQTWSRLERMQRQRKQAATDAQRQSEQTASALAGTKQTQSGSTHSKQESTTNPVVPTPLQPTANLSSPAPAPINGRTGEANGTRPE
jgi:hypothetical protein